MEDLEALYERPLSADRTGPLYNAFSYPTKISAESVALYVACHTRPGDHVLDVFGGSGTTGLAALLCERPTERMLALAAARGLEPQWGPRNATIYELSSIGALVASVMTSAPNPDDFAKSAQRLIRAAEHELPDLYGTISADGQPGTIRQVIWSDVVACPSCGMRTTYADVRVRYGPLRLSDVHECACGYSGAVDGWARVLELRKDPWTGLEALSRVRVPWKVYGASGAARWTRPAVEADLDSEVSSESAELGRYGPIREIAWGDLHRSGYHTGITHLHNFYTARNFRALATLWRLIEVEPEHLRNALRLLVLSFNASHSTLMTRAVLKTNSKDFVMTGAQSGVMYISGLPVEKNVFAGVARKVSTFVAAFRQVHGLTGNVRVVNASSARLDLGDESIDYVFTDPPFGAYIPYSEINQINELWLGSVTDTADEAIISPAQGKGVAEYRALLTSVFSEVQRVLKPDAEATVVFHSSQASVWQALVASLEAAGMQVAAASILDKTQGSFKQVNGDIAVSGDPLLRVRRAPAGDLRVPPQRTMEQLLADPGPRASGESHPTPRHARHRYSAALGMALVEGVPITVDARTAYQLQGFAS